MPRAGRTLLRLFPRVPGIATVVGVPNAWGVVLSGPDVASLVRAGAEGGVEFGVVGPRVLGVFVLPGMMGSARHASWDGRQCREKALKWSETA